MSGSSQDEKPKKTGKRRSRKRVGVRERLWMLASKVLGVAHKTNESGNNMSQR